MTEAEKIIYRKGYQAGWEAGKNKNVGFMRPTKDILKKQQAWVERAIKEKRFK